MKGGKMQRHRYIIKLLTFGIILLFLGTNFFPFISAKGNQPKTASNVIVVDNEGDGDYQTIQEAIEHAEAGDTIHVYSGTYNENIVINKQLILDGIALEYQNGNDTGKPTINGRTSKLLVSFFAANILFSGFSLIGDRINKTDTGITLYHSFSAEITRNNISNCHLGINLTTDLITRSCLIFKNNLSYCSEGIRIANSNNMVYENNIINSENGISIWPTARNCDIYKNIFIGINAKDSIGIFVLDGVNISIYNNQIENFNQGLNSQHGNFEEIVIPHPFNQNENDFRNKFFFYQKNPNVKKINIQMNSIKILEYSNLSLSRSIKVYHNSFINNTENACFLSASFALRTILLLSILALGKEIIYPRLLTRDHFYENYWDDKPENSAVYPIYGEFYRFSILLVFSMLIILILLYGPFLPYLDSNGIPLVTFDLQPLDEPYGAGIPI